MSTASEMEAEWGPLIGALSSAFAAGQRDIFVEILDRLGEARQRGLYEELRELSGSLRFALDQFRLDSRLATLVGKEVPDARVRLDHALKLTEEGAHRTLDLVERSCPLADRTAKEAAALVAPLRSVRSGVTDPGELEALLARMDLFLAAAQRDGDIVRANLTEVLMAQSYQDLSGQIIRGVITLVGEVERTLAHFAVLAGDSPPEVATTTAAPGHPSNSQGFGPAVPGLSMGAVGEQDDVDALLAGLACDMSRPRNRKRNNLRVKIMNQAIDSNTDAADDASPAPADGTLRLESATVRTAAALKAELVTRLELARPVCIDGRAVERIDTATLQLLAAFSRDMRAASRPVEWRGHSAALARAADSLGLGPVLGLSADNT